MLCHIFSDAFGRRAVINSGKINIQYLGLKGFNRKTFYFFLQAERYDKLLKEYGQQELEKWQLVRVSEDFRVIALGLPVPHYLGNPLDPPLRSRFQSR